MRLGSPRHDGDFGCALLNPPTLSYQPDNVGTMTDDPDATEGAPEADVPIATQPITTASGGELSRSSAALTRSFRGIDILPQYAKIAEQLNFALTPSVERLLRDQFRVADFVTPNIFRGVELAATSQVANILANQTAISAWRSALRTDDLVKNVLGAHAVSLSVLDSKVLENLTRLSKVSVGLTSWAAALAPGATVLRGLSSTPAVAYRNYLADLPSTPTHLQLGFSVSAGHGVNGLVATEVLTGELTEDEDEEATERVVGEVIAPWREAPFVARTELLMVLGEVDPKVPTLLDGAWDDVGRQGPAALEKVATCAIEALDRSIRAAARDEDVREWLRDRGGEGSLDDGRPTRAARIRYLLRDRMSDAKLVVSQAESIVKLTDELVRRIQAAKHASSGNLATVRAHLVSVEAVLHELFAAER
jgi:hypothetical protein